MTERCEKCGAEVSIGEWPFCPHGIPLEYHPFKPRYDIALGKYIGSHAERWSAMKNNEHGKLDYAPVPRGEPGWEI